jgi:hypothetical protein
MKPQSAKAKGRRLQQRVVQAIRRTFPHLSEDDVRSTSMGCGGEDIQLSPLARASVPFSIECKCVEKLNVWASLEQAVANAHGNAPCLVFSRNNAPTYAAVPLDTLLDLLQPRTDLPPRLRALLVELSTYAADEKNTG